MTDAERRTMDATPAMTYSEAFQIPLGIALLCLLLEPFIPEAPRRRFEP
jgi:hypothetical protein